MNVMSRRAAGEAARASAAVHLQQLEWAKLQDVISSIRATSGRLSISLGNARGRARCLGIPARILGGCGAGFDDGRRGFGGAAVRRFRGREARGRVRVYCVGLFVLHD